MISPPIFWMAGRTASAPVLALLEQCPPRFARVRNLEQVIVHLFSFPGLLGLATAGGVAMGQAPPEEAFQNCSDYQKGREGEERIMVHAIGRGPG